MAENLRGAKAGTFPYILGSTNCLLTWQDYIVLQFQFDT
jgi:hypothetical protein